MNKKDKRLQGSSSKSKADLYSFITKQRLMAVGLGLLTTLTIAPVVINRRSLSFRDLAIDEQYKLIMDTARAVMKQDGSNINSKFRTDSLLVMNTVRGCNPILYFVYPKYFNCPEGEIDPIDSEILKNIGQKIINYYVTITKNPETMSEGVIDTILLEYMEGNARHATLNLTMNEKDCLNKYISFKLFNKQTSFEKEIKKRLSQLQLKANEMSQIEYAAAVHQLLVEVHPFQDGNGRTARSLVNKILEYTVFDSKISCERGEQNDPYCSAVKTTFHPGKEDSFCGYLYERTQHKIGDLTARQLEKERQKDCHHFQNRQNKKNRW